MNLSWLLLAAGIFAQGPQTRSSYWELNVVALESPTEAGRRFVVWAGFRNVSDGPRLICRYVSSYSTPYGSEVGTPHGVSGCSDPSRTSFGLVLPGQTLFVPVLVSLDRQLGLTKRPTAKRAAPGSKLVSDTVIEVDETVMDAQPGWTQLTRLELKWQGTIDQSVKAGRRLSETR